jgi:hypothetical protein
MGNIIVCSGNLIQAEVRANDVVGVLACDTPWEIVPYVEPADSTAIYAQLVALNEFDPVKIASIVTFCMVMFIVGFGVGLVIRNLRRL